MMQQSQAATRMVLVVLLAIAHLLLLLSIITSAQRESSLVPLVVSAEESVRQMASRGNEAQTLRDDLKKTNDALAALRASFPSDLSVGIFDRVAQNAQRSGVTDFRYQRKGEFNDTLPSGTYRVFRYGVQARGSQDRLLAFLDDLQKETGAATYLENVTVAVAGQEWQLNADIVIYTLVN